MGRSGQTAAPESRTDSVLLDVGFEEDDLDRVLGEAQDVVLIYGEQGEYLYVNPPAERFLGRRRSEILGRMLRDFGLSQNVLEHFEADRQTVMASGEPVRSEVSLDADGTDRRYEYALSPVRSAAGPVAAVVAVVRDVTPQRQAEAERERLLTQITMERQRAEKAARDAELRARELDAVITDMDDAVNVYSASGVLTRANPASVSEFGFDPSGIDVETLRERLAMRHPDDRPFTREDLPSSRGLRGEHVTRQRVLFTDSRGRDRIALVSVSPLTVDDHILGAVGVWSDITDLERALVDLSFERSRLEAVVEQMPSGVIIAEAPSGGIPLMNRQARELLEHPSGTVPGIDDLIRYPQQILHPDGRPYRPEEYPLARALRKAETVVAEETLLVRTDGEQRILSINAGPIRDGDDRVIAAVSTLYDITGRRMAERERDAARQRLLEAERERKRFYREVIRAITHDRFCLVEPEEIPVEGQLVTEVSLGNEDGYHSLREGLDRASKEIGISEAGAKDILLAAGEAAANAIEHGIKPRAAVYRTDDRVTVRVCDSGPGIRPEELPASLFRPGFSTKVSLGMGYTIMLVLADRLWLATGPEGTILQLEKLAHPEKTQEEVLPVAWERL